MPYYNIYMSDYDYINLQARYMKRKFQYGYKNVQRYEFDMYQEFTHDENGKDDLGGFVLSYKGSLPDGMFKLVYEGIRVILDIDEGTDDLFSLQDVRSHSKRRFPITIGN